MSQANSDPALALQKGVFAALTAHPAMVATFAALANNAGAPRVYDRVPVDTAGKVKAPFPYLTIGEDELIGQTNQNTDVTEAHVKVEVWSRATDKGEVKALAAAARAALDCPLPLLGHSIDTHTFMGTLFRREPDGLTERAIIRVRFQTVPAAPPVYR